MSKPLDTLRESLFSSGLVQPLDSSGRGGSVSILCREVPGQTKGWVSLVDELLTAAGEKYELHVCRRYVRKNGKMAFGWFIGIETKNAKELFTAVQELAPIIVAGRSKFVTAQVIPLVSKRKTAAVQEEVEEQRPGYRPDFQLQQFTKANPRAPEYSGPDPKVPREAVFRATTRREGDQVITEMPLPHVHTRDINRPAPGSNKGAALQGRSAELFAGLKVGKE